MADYKIIPLNKKELLIIILSLEMTQKYLNRLLLDLGQMKLSSSVVYFDFLYRNGTTTRFFKSSYDGNSLAINNAAFLKNVPEICVKKADMFFYKNFKKYKGCVLSASKMQLLLQQIRSIYHL